MATLRAPAGAADPLRQKINKHGGCPHHPLVAVPGLSALSPLPWRGWQGHFSRQRARGFVGGGTGKPQELGRSSWGIGAALEAPSATF